MKKYILALTMLGLMGNTMAAESPAEDKLLAESFACVSEDLFTELVRAAVKSDQQHMKSLLGNGCIFTTLDMKISLLDSSWGKAKIRLYLENNKSVVLWTNTEALSLK